MNVATEDGVSIIGRDRDGARVVPVYGRSTPLSLTSGDETKPLDVRSYELLTGGDVLPWEAELRITGWVVHPDFLVATVVGFVESDRIQYRVKSSDGRSFVFVMGGLEMVSCVMRCKHRRRPVMFDAVIRARRLTQ